MHTFVMHVFVPFGQSPSGGHLSYNVEMFYIALPNTNLGPWEILGLAQVELLPREPSNSRTKARCSKLNCILEHFTHCTFEHGKWQGFYSIFPPTRQSA